MKGADSSMDTILQEISKEDALERYLEGEDIQVLRPTTNGRLAMWSMSELFQGSRFLVESNNKKSVSLVMNLEDPGFENSIKDLFEHPSSAEHIPNAAIHQEIQGSELTKQGDCIIDTEDQSRKRRVRIDLGKLKSLRDAGWKPKDIAEELHCSVQSVRNYWNKV